MADKIQGDEPKKFSSQDDELKAIELEIRKEELEALRLQKEERTYSIRDLKQRLGTRDIKEQQLREDREAQGRTFAQQEATDILRWKICTHKKGGVATPRDLRVLTTGGNGQQYSVIKHQMINGDVWVRCQRCGRTWTPPVKDLFYFDKDKKQVPKHLGEFHEEKFETAVLDYHRALQFETNNSMSTSVVCRFSRYDAVSKQWVDAAQDYRENVKDSNLR